MKILFAIVALIGTALLAGSLLQRTPEPLQTTQGRASSASPVAASRPPDSADLAALHTSPQVREYRERQAFEDRMRHFLQQADALRPVERNEQARALEAQIDEYEANQGLSAGEALLLRSGLIDATVADEAQRADRIAALMERYRVQAAQRTAQHIADQRSDPRFANYKARERAIIAKVAAMHTFPDGLTRDQYLRQRLQAERERIYR